MMYKFWTYISTLSILLLGCGSSLENQAGQRPNILLINVDDLGWRDLGFMGSTWYETPNLDSLAAMGMVFTRAYAGAANCAPSRSCMLSGLNTPRHGVYTVASSERGDTRTRRIIPVENTRILADSFYLLPEMLKSAGYVTASFGKWHLGPDPLSQGIDYNVGGSHRGHPGRHGYFSPYQVDHLEDGPEGEYLTDRLTEEAISWLKSVKDSSFFLYLPYYTVHTPLMGKPDLVSYFKRKPAPTGQSNPVYASMITALDQNVGKLLQTLSDLGLEENTLVIFTSDNGGIRAISDQAPLRAGKGSYYEGGIRVPLVLRWPGHIAAGVRNDEMVSQLDIFPTLQELVQPPKRSPELDGRSLLDQFSGPTSVLRNLYFHFPVYLEAYRPNRDDGRDPLFRTRPGSVIIAGRWKLHEYYEDDGIELYDLESDPGEREELSGTYPALKDSLRATLQNWRKVNQAPEPLRKNPHFDEIYEAQQLGQWEK